MKQLLFVSVLAMLFFSCSKQETQTPASNSSGYAISNYSKLTVGNYWIYQIYNVDTLGNATPAGTDSCYIKNDSIVNRNTYAVVYNYPLQTGISLLRDSADFLIDQHGNIRFAYGYFNTVLYSNDTISYTYSISYNVPSSQATVVVPLGTFACYDYKGTYTYITTGKVRYAHNYYAFNIGLVELVTFYLDSPGTLQYRLARSHVR
jgi:hypothetical protein